MCDYVQLMRDFGDAFNRHDEDALGDMMTEDCVFYTLAGEHSYGNVIEGNAAIKQAFANVWNTMPDARWEMMHCFASESDGLSQWVFTGTDSSGARIDAQGCDIFTFSEGKIASKNAFRKQCPVRRP